MIALGNSRKWAFPIPGTNSIVVITMDTQATNTVRNGFQSFLPEIKFHTLDKPANVIRQAIECDPKITYYLHSYTISGMCGRYEIKAQYINKDTDKSDIQMVLSQNECEYLICNFVGKYRKNLIAIAKGKMDLGDAINSFHEKHASFYPNLTKIKGSQYHSNSSYSVFEFSFEYRIGRVKLAQMEQEVESEVKRIAKTLFVPGMSNEAKIYLAHNYLATSVDYVDSDDNRLDLSYTQSAYGALIRKQCVCQGFAEAFKRLMDYAGIDCTVIYGRTSGSSVLHAWNIVSLGKGSSYYHIDVTWDSTGNKPSYTYFCKNDSFFDGKRNWNKEYIPRCCGSYPVLAVARKIVLQNKENLISRGIDEAILDC